MGTLCCTALHQNEDEPMTDVDLSFTSAAEQARLIAAGRVTARQVVEHTLERIAALDPVLNAFAVVLAEESRAAADELDARQAAGEALGRLHGVPIAIKDENDVAGVPTAFGGAAFTTPAAADSEIVRKLRAAGAIIIGKTRMPEFGIWPFTETSANGYTRNPWNPQFSTAGSSGGTAAAVASGMVAAAIGGDGGGSIRLPSSWCGLFGLKCQRGRTSAAPNSHLWRALGVVGPLTRTVEDSALIYDVISGSTETDVWRAEPLEGSLVEALARDSGPLRIAVSLKNPTGSASPDTETVEAIHATAAALRELGHTVVDVDPRYPSLGTTFMAQVARGVRDEAERAEYPELLEKRTRDFVKFGRVFGGGVERAERRGVELGAAFDADFFAAFDLLITPTTPSPAVPVGQLDGAGAVAAIRKATPVASFTGIWNVLGNPAAAIPTGWSASGLPLSAQIIGPANSEPLILELSAQLEKSRPWAGRRPPVSE